MLSDGQRLVFHAGAALYLFEPTSGEARRLDTESPRMRTQRNRKFVSAAEYPDSYTLHPQGYAVALTTRGKPFTLRNSQRPVPQPGQPDVARYRTPTWLNGGERPL